MKITVHLFARARDLAGASSVVVERPDGASLGELRRRLAEQIPALTALLRRSSLAVDNEFAGDDTVLSPSSEVAVLPPVSGG